MMPIFFNAASHLWIAYTLFANGLLISIFLRAKSDSFRGLTNTLDALTLSAFFISISLNGLVLLILQWLDLPFLWAARILPVVSLVLVVTCWWAGRAGDFFSEVSLSGARLLLYFLVFGVLFLNGGLIEHVTDAWWHMSLANKIGMEGAFVPETGHLTGLPTRYYPPLWHGNLALLQIISGESLAVIWNSFTAWGGVLKVMAFFLMARALTGSDVTGGIAAVLFVLLPGIGNSYLRVSAWPSHIAYTAWFLMFALVFNLSSKVQTRGSGLVHLRSLFSMRWIDASVMVQCLALLWLAAVVYFVHKAELLYFALGLFFYFLGLAVVYVWRGRNDPDMENAAQLYWVYGLFLSGLIAFFAADLLFNAWQSISTDQRLSYLLAPSILLVILLLSVGTSRLPALPRRMMLIGLLLLLFASLDYRQVVSLFNNEMAYPRSGTHEMAMLATGFFGGELKAPGWHLQLRQGLLYSGIFALPLSILMAYFRPTRESLFLASNCILVMLILASPYHYNWVYDLLGYHSPWRIAILIWHPIVFAMLFTWLCGIAWRKQ